MALLANGVGDRKPFRLTREKSEQQAPHLGASRVAASVDDSVAGRRPASQTTIEALDYQLRGGVNALREQSALRRLTELDRRQIKDLAGRLTKERWSKDGTHRVPPWTPDEIEIFIEAWSISNERYR